MTDDCGLEGPEDARPQPHQMELKMRRLQQLSKQDPERAHLEAGQLLAAILVTVGYSRVVDIYNSLEKH